MTPAVSQSNSQRIIPYILYFLVLISSLLVGLSLDSSRLIAIAIIGATLGFLCADVFKVFRIRGVLANIASIVILLLAMKDFFPGDSTGKLISVANLLVYLQTVLMFQEKTPRLNWQILILSLLQVVVAAIFSLNFEAGLLFLLYFFAVAVALLVQSAFMDQYEILIRNRLATSTLGQSLNENGTYRDSEPLTFFDGSDQKGSLRSMSRSLLLWMLVSLVFTGIMFSQIPRQSQSWFGPPRLDVASTSASKSVDLDERDIIEQSGAVMFRVDVVDNRTGELMDLEANAPYFRGMALSSLVIEDGKTNWRAPHDRVFKRLYEQLRLQRGTGRTARMRIKFEESSDPLVYPVTPVFRNNQTPQEIVFCQEISAITRCQIGRKIEIAPFAYEATTLLEENGRFSDFWPFLSNMDTEVERPMSFDPPQHEWLTLIDESRYPNLVATASKLGARHQSLERIKFLKKFEQFFNLPTSGFKYTLDFRKIERNESVDPIEDFFANHKSGHCELYASALTLMLRQQDIPARVVLGFHGAEKNPFTGDWIVRARNAHAWVEAYLRPEDCTPDMVEKGIASTGGAWMRLDPTPLSGLPDANVGEEAIDLARTVWDDYVLGNDEESALENSQAPTSSLLSFLDSADFQMWERRIQDAQDFSNTSEFKYSASAAVLIIVMLIWFRAGYTESSQVSKKQGRLRRLFAGAIALISPELGNWVMEGSASNRSTAFYEKMSKLLAPFELQRSPTQTHREFASDVAAHFSDHPKASTIRSSVFEITRWFNEVRFGSVEIDEGVSRDVGESLKSLKEALNQVVEMDSSSS